MLPHSGDVLYVGPAASVQFSGDSAIRFRVIRVDPAPTYEGWLWLDGYQIGLGGDAVERRQIFVRQAGLRLVEPSQPAKPSRPTNAGPARPRTGAQATRGSRA